MSGESVAGPSHHDAPHLADYPLVHLHDDGTIDCEGCGLNIAFLPPTFPAAELPDGAPATVNHAGCGKAMHGTETVNRIDKSEVADFYTKANG